MNGDGRGRCRLFRHDAASAKGGCFRYGLRSTSLRQEDSSHVAPRAALATERDASENAARFEPGELVWYDDDASELMWPGRVEQRNEALGCYRIYAFGDSAYVAAKRGLGWSIPS
jgi:hypothetical protein